MASKLVHIQPLVATSSDPTKPAPVDYWAVVTTVEADRPVDPGWGVTLPVDPGYGRPVLPPHAGHPLPVPPITLPPMPEPPPEGTVPIVIWIPGHGTIGPLYVPKPGGPGTKPPETVEPKPA